MSIPFSVAATLARGDIAEDNYASLEDPEILRLIAATDLEAEAAFTAAFPARQGAEVTVHLRDGKTIRHRLPDVVAATTSGRLCRIVFPAPKWTETSAPCLAGKAAVKAVSI